MVDKTRFKNNVTDLLRSRGYDVTDAATLDTALTDFQATEGLTITGKWTKETVDALHEIQDTPLPQPAPTDMRKSGEFGTTVRDIATKLNMRRVMAQMRAAKGVSMIREVFGKPGDLDPKSALPSFITTKEDPAAVIEDDGLLEEGNIDITRHHLTTEKNGGSLIRTMSVDHAGATVLLPTVTRQGEFMSDDGAVDHYLDTGQHLGKFASPEHAADYAAALHAHQMAALGLAPLSSSGMAALNPTVQEQHLYEHHVNNLVKGKRVVNPDSSVSTVLQMSFEHDGKTYNIPSVWDGKVLKPHDALMRSLKEGGGWDYWPSYPSEGAAEERYGQMHSAMEQDMMGTADLFDAGPYASGSLAGFGHRHVAVPEGDVTPGATTQYKPDYVNGPALDDNYIQKWGNGTPPGLFEATDSAVSITQRALMAGQDFNSALSGGGYGNK